MSEKVHHRIISLDSFRGATIAAMILVNNPGSFEESFPQLRHAAWHGWTLTDWIFPFFLWIVGVSMAFSFARRMEKGRRGLLAHALRRAAILVGLGLFINGFPFGLLGESSFAWETIRIPGVLQRIAICYLAGSIILLYCGVRAQLVWTVSLLVLYAAILRWIPVPGHGPGVLDPVGNIVGFIDGSLLHGHTWIYAPAEGFDPEGILSTIPALATLLSGILTGHLLRSSRGPAEKGAWMFAAGYLLMIAGAFADMFLPINKNLWTSSYVLLTSGAALVVFATFYVMIDLQGWKRWATPFVVLGMNAITAFVLSEILATALWSITWAAPGGNVTTLHDWMYESWFLPAAGLRNGSLLFALSFLLLLYPLFLFMWKRRIFLRV